MMDPALTTPPVFKRLNVVPTYRVLAQSITDMILSGGLKPGDPLPTEQVLCEQFGVNRSSVREGVRLLEESGLLRRVNPKRLVISRPTAYELGSQLKQGLLLHEVTFQELWETAMVIEPKTAWFAAEHLLPADIEALEDNLRATEGAIGDGAALAAFDMEFHKLVGRGVHNRVWELTREPMVRLFYPSFEAVLTKVPTSGRRLLKAHQSIVSVLKQGKAAEASEWMEKHIRDFKRGFELAGLDLHSPALQPGRPEPG
jgi:GntR family transcriptional repressor for pyruvate dehydrogenase complex